MNKCAFDIPLHPKHFNYGYYIIYKLQNSDVDLYFIFTNIEDKNNFYKELKDDIILNFLLLTDFTDIKIVEEKRSFVPIKKLYALSVLYKKYEYISCIDSEIKFMKKNGFYQIMKNIVSNKIICGGKLDNNNECEKGILYESIIRLTDNIYHNDLRNISQDFSIYTWWCNLPVYDCKNSEDFLNWIHFNNTNLERFSFFIFDDMTYNYYCILFHNYQLKEIPNCKHCLEFSDSSLVEYVDQNLYKLYWVNNNAYNQNKEYYENNNFYIIFHLDRWKE